jgi:serine/threonine protein kinase
MTCESFAARIMRGSNNMALRAGTRLGPYEIVSLIGAGGMGEVYEALDTRLDRSVAIKVLPAQLSDDSDALARFQREAKAVAALSHPSILAISTLGRQMASRTPSQNCLRARRCERDSLTDRSPSVKPSSARSRSQMDSARHTTKGSSIGISSLRISS